MNGLLHMEVHCVNMGNINHSFWWHHPFFPRWVDELEGSMWLDPCIPNFKVSCFKICPSINKIHSFEVTTHDDPCNAHQILLCEVMPIIHNLYAGELCPLGLYIMKLKEMWPRTPVLTQVVALNSIMHTTLGIPLDILNHVSLMGWT